MLLACDIRRTEIDGTDAAVVITHDGQRKNGFAECADDTMNPRGKGNYEGHEQKGHHHRKLLDRIDLK